MAATNYSPESKQSTVEFDRTLFQDPAFRSALDNLAARFNRRQMTVALVRAFAVGFAICAALMLLHRLYLADVTSPIIIAILAACGLIGWRNGSLNQSNAFRAALDADRTLGLNERLSSAAAFAFPDEVINARRVQHTGKASQLKNVLFPRYAMRTAHVSEPTQLVPDLMRDAATRAVALDAKTIYPIRFGRREKFALAAVVAFAGISLMPNLELFRTPEQRALAAVLNKKGRDLEEVAKRALAKKDEGDETTKKLAKKLEKLGQKMQRGRMTKREALTSMGELRKQLETTKGDGESKNGGGLEKVEQGLAGKEMESPAGQELKRELLRQDTDAQQKAEAAARALEKLADKMERGELSQKEKEQAARDLKKAAEALRKSGGQQNQQAAKNLEEAAKSLQQQSKEGQKQNGQGGQQGQKQQGQKGDQQNGKQGDGSKSGQQQGQQGQKSGEGKQGQQGQKQGGQQGQQQQGGQQGQNQQGQQGQQGGKQGQQQQGEQQGQGQGQQSQQGQQGSQGGEGQQGQGQEGSQNGQQGGSQSGGQQGQQGQGSQGGANALRNAAKDLRDGAGGSGSGSSSEMLDKLREAENDTGQNSGEGSGQGEGQGKNGKGQGQGNGEGGEGESDGGTQLSPTDPHGQVGGGAGLGPRSNATGRQSGGGVSKIKGAKSNDKRRWADVWSDRLPPTEKKLSRINGKMGNNGQMERIPIRSDAKGGPVKTPYYDVYESYRKDAEDAVSRDAVPPAYKAPVKSYFDSIKPK